MIQHINDADLYYEEYGQGDRYILSSMQIFDPNGKGWPFDLADEGFHVFLIQMRGYGQSTHIYENYNNNWYDVWADDVWAFARAQGIPHFLYTGQSDGAAIGWHLYFRHPEVLVGFAGLAPGPHSRENLFVTPPRQRSMETISDPAAREQMAQYQRQLMLQFAKKFADDPELRE
ncbi:MAG: alpha/beta hydrolase [Lachnospiraceae bacterium]|nr:alpha/beta hydrolase [Lachnospiraceae bacterium]